MKPSRTGWRRPRLLESHPAGVRGLKLPVCAKASIMACCRTPQGCVD